MKKVFLSFFVAAFVVACNDTQKTETPMVKTAATTEPAKSQASEFADPMYMDMGKQMLHAFEAGDIDKWMTFFADTAMYRWSSGDSLAGKTAIASYWKNRRANVIDKIHFANDIWIPIKVNTPQRGPDRPGVWLLNWYQVNSTYKNGKSLSFWVHSDYHFNNDNKVDQAILYIDRAPINAAAGMK